MLRIDQRSLLWANQNAPNGDTDWFDVTGARVEPARFQFGLGRDTIPSIDQPVFARAGDARLAEAGINSESLVVGFEADGESRAYPIAILNRHEVVNDMYGNQPLTVGW